ncbi:Hypothetical predicted protein, partial [Olea europaea subsp. europaea]
KTMVEQPPSNPLNSGQPPLKLPDLHTIVKPSIPSSTTIQTPTQNSTKIDKKFASKLDLPQTASVDTSTSDDTLGRALPLVDYPP